MANVVVVIPALCLVACSPSVDSLSAPRGWSAEFEHARSQTASSEIAQAVLADDQVTDAEMLEVDRLLVDCLEMLGFPGAVVDSGGGLTIPDSRDGGDVGEADRVCEESSGWAYVSMLYHAVRINPGNVDWDELMAACLVRQGVVPESYRGEDHRRQWQEFTDAGDSADLDQVITFSDDDRGPSAYRSCEADPLG